MSRNPLTPISFAVALASLVACGTEEPATSQTAHNPDSAQQSLQNACAQFPELPGCGAPREPQPGFAKFTAGNAEALRWVGQHGCRKIDVRTGRQAGSKLIRAMGDVQSSCDANEASFSFVFVQHPDGSGTAARTSAFLPKDTGAARRLLDSCTPDTRPHPSLAIGSWWKVNNTYAEGLFQSYMSPLVYATRLMPFDDDGYEQLDDAVLNGVTVARFRNDQATLWMDKSERDRPLRVTSDKDLDMTLTDWNKEFDASIPSGLRDPGELCTLAGRAARQ